MPRRVAAGGRLGFSKRCAVAAFDLPYAQAATEHAGGRARRLRAGGQHPRPARTGRKPTETALPGFRPAQPVVFCGLFPVDASDFEELREAMGKLRLNDASFSFEMETTAALGFGFRCGFLGLLHLEIIQERLAREFDLDLIATAPSVVYQVELTTGEARSTCTTRPTCPKSRRIKEIREPWIKATILTPDEYLGSILKLCQDRRGIQRNMTYVGNRAMIEYDLPLNEVVFDFYDRLKSMSKGYASFDYTLGDYREGDLVKLSILVNSEPVDALSMLVHRNAAGITRPADVRKAQGTDPAPSVRHPDPGRHRRQDHRPRNRSAPCART